MVSKLSIWFVHLLTLPVHRYRNWQSNQRIVDLFCDSFLENGAKSSIWSVFAFLPLATGEVIQCLTGVVCHRFTDRVENQRQKCKKEERTKVRSWVSIGGGEGLRIRIVNRVPVNTLRVYQHQRFKNAQIEDESRKNVDKGEGRLQIARFRRSLCCSWWRTEPCCVLAPNPSILSQPVRWEATPLCIFGLESLYRLHLS